MIICNRCRDAYAHAPQHKTAALYQGGNEDPVWLVVQRDSGYGQAGPLSPKELASLAYNIAAMRHGHTERATAVAMVLRQDAAQGELVHRSRGMGVTAHTIAPLRATGRRRRIIGVTHFFNED